MLFFIICPFTNLHTSFHNTMVVRCHKPTASAKHWCDCPFISNYPTTTKKKLLMTLKLFFWADAFLSSKKAILSAILVATLIKASFLVYLTHCGNPEIKLGIISFAGGDTFSYTGAMENYV